MKKVIIIAEAGVNHNGYIFFMASIMNLQFSYKHDISLHIKK